MGRAAGIPPHPPAARKPGASASGAALPAGAQRAALPGQLTLRVPAQEAPHARPSLPGACPSWVLSGRGRGQVGQRSLSGKGGSRTSPLALRPHGEALSVAGSGGLVSLLSDPRPREGPETQKSPLLVPFPHLTPGSQDTLSGIEPPTLDPGVRGGPRAPRPRVCAPPQGRSRRAPGHVVRAAAGGCAPQFSAFSPPGLAHALPSALFSRALPAASPGSPVCLSSRARRGPHAWRLKPWDR